jgi:excisionase family DNA binding protein
MGRPVETLTLTVPEAAAALGVGHSTMRLLVDRGDIPSLRIGKRVVISRKELAAWLDAHADATIPGAAAAPSVPEGQSPSSCLPGTGDTGVAPALHPTSQQVPGSPPGTAA